MKNFFSQLLATIVGILLVGFIGTLIFIGIISAIIASQDKGVEIKDHTVFMLKLDKKIVDRKSSFPFDVFNFQESFNDPVLGLNDILNCIEKAKNDDKIKGIYLEAEHLMAEYGTVNEIRNSLLDFKKSGKFVIAYGDELGQKEYYLASASDKIYMNPEGFLYITGLSSELIFLKNTFDKLGIEPQIIRHGKFKSAVEPLMDTKMSDENREQIKTFAGSIWKFMTEEISKSRNISVEKINLVTDNLDLWNADKAIENNFVDSLIYRDELIDILKKKCGTDSRKEPEIVTVQEYSKVPKPRSTKGLVKQKIAVIYAHGTIQGGEEFEENMGGHKIARTIREARQDSSIKAIVFRVNSGGGDALASELIWREIDLASKVKPVIASMGDYAASGGYWIVTPADTIVADPLTLTGSIGVFGVFFNAKEFFNKKIGITSDVEKTNKYSDFGSPFRALSPYEREVMQSAVDKVYNTFLNHVSSGRSLTYEEVDKIGEGRIWSAINAKEIGLIDLFGGLNDAVKIAAEKAELENYRIVELPKQEDPLQQIFKGLSNEVKNKIIRSELEDDYRYYEILEDARNMRGIQSRLPFEIKLN